MLVFLGHFFEVAGGLGLFFLGMKMMSEAIQRIAGDRLHKFLSFITRNRFMSVLSGFFITAIIQSSSATSVLVISFINAGLLTLVESIGVIMGANLGTTVTIWIVSLLGFKFSVASLSLPIIGCGIPFILSKKTQWNDIGSMLFGFGLLFLGLSFMKEGVPDIKSNPEILRFLSQYTHMGFLSFMIFIFVGTVLAAIIQSSSAVGAITVMMAFKGWIDFPSAAAVILGSNIGTTITANLATIGLNVNAKRAAIAHLLFNLFGVIWALALYLPIVKLLNFIESGIESGGANITIYISVFHTLFNLINIVVLIAFIPQMAKLVERIIKPGDGDGKKRKYKLEYMTSVLKTPEMFILEARKEIIKMAIVSYNMFQVFLGAFLASSTEKEVEKALKKVKKQEDLSDRMKDELTNFLAGISKENLNESCVYKVTALMRIVNELESIADCCYNLVKATRKKYKEDLSFHPKANDEITNFSDEVIEFMLFNIENLQDARLSDEGLKKAIELETKIDLSREALRERSVKRIGKTGQVESEMLFMEIIKNFERMGDYSLNISEALKKMV